MSAVAHVQLDRLITYIKSKREVLRETHGLQRSHTGPVDPTNTQFGVAKRIAGDIG